MSVPHTPASVQDPVSQMHSIASACVVFVVPVPPAADRVPTVRTDEMIVESIMRFDVMLDSY